MRPAGVLDATVVANKLIGLALVEATYKLTSAITNNPCLALVEVHIPKQVEPEHFALGSIHFVVRVSHSCDST